MTRPNWPAAVLVTGASSGIGLATAVAFARKGDRVFGSVRNGDGARALRSAAAEAGVAVEPVTFDVTDDASVQEAVAGIAERVTGIGVLVNNAGISYLGALETTPDATWRELFEVNVLGLIRVTRAVLPHMRAAGSGVIVNVTSANGKVPAVYGGAYSATKFAVEGLSESLLFEVEPFGIDVVVVEPGQFDTPIFEKMQKAANVDPASPYAAAEARLLAASLPAPGQGGDPNLAAEVIVSAARAEREGFRHPAGADAEALLAARASAAGDDAWLDLVRGRLAALTD